MQFGNTKIGGMSFGSTKIGGVKYGNTLVYQSGPSIPDGPVEYIETDGAAYINTGIIGKWPKSCEMKVLIVNTDFACFLGSRVANNGMRFQPVMNMSNRVDFGTSNSYYSGVDITASITNRTPVLVRASLKRATGSYIAAKQEGESEYTSKSGTSYPGGSSPTTDLNMFLFALNNGGVASGFEPNGTRLYYCKIYSDADLTTLIFDGVPWRYNKKYGLWDNVSNSFFGNANSTGAFSGGPSLTQ